MMKMEDAQTLRAVERVLAATLRAARRTMDRRTYRAPDATAFVGILLQEDAGARAEVNRIYKETLQNGRWQGRTSTGAQLQIRKNPSGGWYISFADRGANLRDLRRTKDASAFFRKPMSVVEYVRRNAKHGAH